MISVNWPDLRGRNYTFETYPIGTTFYEVGGVYVFCKPCGDGQWEAVYVGETTNFNQRLNTALKHHHAWPTCAMHGATHIGVYVVSGVLRDHVRLEIETSLRHSLRPIANRQAA